MQNPNDPECIEFLTQQKQKMREFVSKYNLTTVNVDKLYPDYIK